MTISSQRAGRSWALEHRRWRDTPPCASSLPGVDPRIVESLLFAGDVRRGSSVNSYWLGKQSRSGLLSIEILSFN